MGSVPLGDDPEVFDLSPDGRTAYVSTEEDGALDFFDMAAKKRDQSVPSARSPKA